jgi:hypothetical protein
MDWGNRYFMIDEKKKSNSIDVRNIDERYFHPFEVYTSEEDELFKKPTQLKHFQKRIDCLVRRRENNHIIFLPQGDGNFFLCLKLYVLNLIPTQNKELTRQVYFYLYEILGDKELQIIVKNYAKYLEEFK